MPAPVSAPLLSGTEKTKSGIGNVAGDGFGEKSIGLLGGLSLLWKGAYRWMELRCPGGHAMKPYWDIMWLRVCDNCDGMLQEVREDSKSRLDQDLTSGYVRDLQLRRVQQLPAADCRLAAHPGGGVRPRWRLLQSRTLP